MEIEIPSLLCTGHLSNSAMGGTDFLISLERHTSLEVENSPEFIAIVKRNLAYNHKETIKSLSRQNLQGVRVGSP